MDEEKLTLTVSETARLLGISRGLAYEMVRTGEIPLERGQLVTSDQSKS